MARKIVIEISLPDSWFEDSEEFGAYPEITEGFVTELFASRLPYGGGEPCEVSIISEESES